ncbi:MAG: phosphoribosyltransferase family protein [Actinomycetota bacterium]
MASSTQLVPGNPLISAAEISGRLGELAARVDADYAGRDLLLLGVLRGRVPKEPDTDLTGRNVLVVDDLTDSGLTLSWLIRHLRSGPVASAQGFSLLRKPDVAQVDVPLRYFGFDIPPEFVVGYGMDYAQRYRNLPYIATMEQAA